MTWLLWKDARLNRSLFGVVAALLLVPYVINCATAWSADRPFAPGYLMRSAIWSLVWLQVPLTFIAGQAFAGERMDASAEFLGLLPVSRGRIVASKLLILLGVLALIWIPNLLVLAGAVPLAGNSAPQLFLPWLRAIPFVGLAFVGGAWLCSSRMGNPVFASCLGLFIPTVTLVAGAIVLDLLGYWPQDLFSWARAVCAVLFVTCFVAGTALYMRRTEP